MTRPTKITPGGRAYLDLQNRARREHRGTQELLTLYVLERWLARLSGSPYGDRFVLKGGMLLAVLDARRPTADADLLARRLPNEETAVIACVREVAQTILTEDDGVEFLADTISAESIRDDLYTLTGRHELSYATVRAALDATSAYRDVRMVPLSDVVGELAAVRQSAYTAFRRRLGPDGAHLPAELQEIVLSITAFIDPLVTGEVGKGRWVPGVRRWE